MVPLKGVQETYPLMAYSCIQQLVYSRHGKRVFGASFIQICEVHTYVPFPILLVHHHCIVQPLKVEHFLNNPNLLKLVHILLDNIRMFFR